MTEKYTRSAPDKFKKGWGVKTLFKPYRDIKLSIHRPHIKKAKREPANAERLFDQIWVSGSGERIPDEFSLSGWRSTKPTIGYLLAWLAYHNSIGVDEFCIYSNNCTDGTNLILNRLDQMGIIRHFDNPLSPRMDPQRAALSRAGKQEWVRNADYVLIVDADEFLNIHTGDRSVQALISACGGADAISVNWISNFPFSLCTSSMRGS